MTKLFVAIVHPIGEDNDATFSLVATTLEALHAKLLEQWVELGFGESGDTIEALREDWDWSVDEHEL